jgi:uncharacterized protein (DUF58 family)
MLFGLFLEAYMHDFNLVYITLFFVFAIAFTAGPLGVLNLGNLRGSFETSNRLFAHVEGKISVKIKNNSRHTAWMIKLYSSDKSMIAIPQIMANNHVLNHLPYLPKHRGSMMYEHCYLESKYPLFTARLTLPIHDAYHGMVYPHPKGKSLEAFLNQEQTHYGEEKEFDGLRAYDGSQKLTHIHWPSVAKGELSVKTFIKETQTLNLVFDFYSSGKNDEARLSQLCLWVLACEKKHLPFAIRMPKQYLQSQKESIDEILTVLAKY